MPGSDCVASGQCPGICIRSASLILLMKHFSFSRSVCSEGDGLCGQGFVWFYGADMSIVIE